MIDTSNLELGGCYFLASFFDQKMRYPNIETYIFVGTNLLEEFSEGKTYWYFQDPDSYENQGIFTKIKDKESRDVVRIDGDSIEMVLDYDGLLEFLDEVKRSGSNA